MTLTDAKPLQQLDGAIDRLVMVCGPGSARGFYDGRFLGWMRDAAQRSRRITSVCTGRFLLAAAGLLNGKRAITHLELL